tara:strand:- start:981 stop:2081 length:1101 start_codon:yes stop_codon:yes gene_type:complete
MATKSSKDKNILNVIAEQTFESIIYSKKNIDLIENYFEEDKDYNTNNAPCKNPLIDPITVNYIHYKTNYMKVVNFEYKNIIFTINIYTENYQDNASYIYFIKIAIICCLRDKIKFKEKIFMKIDLYLTELKKTLPKISGSCVKKEHTKSGYSKFDNNIYICIYRKEEWFKSIVQELFFAFTIDLETNNINYKNILKNNIYVKDDFIITNSIIDFFSRLFNISVFLYFEKSVTKLEEFKIEYKKMMLKEKKFSIIQTQKIFNHFGISYSDIIKKENEEILMSKYKDESDLLTYFLITSIMFIHFHRLIQWVNFDTNNFFNIKKSERELVILTHYIAHCSRESETLKYYEESYKKKDNKNIKYCYHRI